MDVCLGSGKTLAVAAGGAGRRIVGFFGLKSRKLSRPVTMICGGFRTGCSLQKAKGKREKGKKARKAGLAARLVAFEILGSALDDCGDDRD
jgi:hypothetical protein